MKRISIALLLVITMFLTGCDLITENLDKIDLPDELGDLDDILLEADELLKDIDESLILSMDGSLEGIYDGEPLSYYFYLPTEISFTFSFEAEFDGVIIIKNFVTDTIVFEDGNSIYDDYVFSTITLDAGGYVIEVSSVDNESGSFSISLGNTMYEFSSIVVDEELSNTFAEGEIHWYSLEIDEASNYLISSSGDFDLEGVILSFEGELIAYSDDISDEDDNFEMLVYLEVGTYKISVRAYDGSVSGTYQLLVETKTASYTTTITMNTTINDDLIIGERNIVEFYVPSDGYVTLSSNTVFDSYGRIYNSDGDLLGEDDDRNGNENFYINLFLESGTYTVEVSSLNDDEGGHYYLWYGFEEDAVYYYQEIVLDGYIVSSITYGEVNTFMLTVTEAMTIDIYCESSEDTYGKIYSEEWDLIAEDDDTGIVSNFLLDNIFLEPGIYFVEVESIFGRPVIDYKLYSKTVDPDAPNENNFTIDLNTSVSKTLDSGIAHYYTFTVVNKGFISAYVVSEFDSSGCILNDQEEFLVCNGDASNYTIDFKIDEFELSPGTYQLAVTGYTTAEFGDYSLYVVFEEGPTSELEILPNGSFSGYLDNDEIRTVSFTLDQGGYIKAYLESAFDSKGFLYELDETLLLQNDDDGDVFNFSLTGIYLAAGTYEISIAGHNSGEYGYFELYLDVVYGDTTNASLKEFPIDYEDTLDAGEYHWYKIEITEAGYLDIYTDASFDSYGYLLDESGKFINQDDDSNGNSDFYISGYFPEPGTYYIVVCGYSPLDSGTYALQVIFTLPIS